MQEEERDAFSNEPCVIENRFMRLRKRVSGVDEEYFTSSAPHISKPFPENWG